MLTINAYWTITAGNEAAARAALCELAKQVEETEPDTWMYLIHVTNTDPGVSSFPPSGGGAVTFLEGYKDQAAFERHVSSKVMSNFLEKHGALFLNMYGPEIPFMETQALAKEAGFTRPSATDPALYTVISRWSILPGNEAKVRRALEGYVSQVYEEEPYTYMYTANVPHQSERLPSFPTSPANQLVFNSGWESHAAFVAHTKAKPYQTFLAEHGHLFLQANGAETSDQPYLTSLVLRRFAGFLRPQAFSAPKGVKS